MHAASPPGIYLDLTFYFRTSLEKREKGMEGLDSSSYLILNKKKNLAFIILFSFMTPKLVLKHDTDTGIQQEANDRFRPRAI